MRDKSLLDRVYLKNPCSSDWTLMQGDNQTRFCSDCNKTVFNLSSMTKRQAEKLLADANGQLCAKFDRDHKGRILTVDRINRIPRVRFRLPRIASTAVTALLGITMSADAQVASNLDRPISVCPLPKSQEKTEKAQSQDGKCTLIGTVFDATRAVISGARVKVKNESANQEQEVITADDGYYRFEKLEPSTYTVKVEAMGFVSFKKTGVELRADERLRIDVTLEVGTTGGVAILPNDRKPKRLFITWPFRGVRRILRLDA